MIQCGDVVLRVPRPLTTTPKQEAKMATKNYTEVGVGSKIGRLLILGVERSGGKIRCLCQCDCGTKKYVVRYHLLANKTVSCGCYQRDMIRARKTTHNKSGTRIYNVWLNMRLRCSDPEHKNFSDYGGRGIKVCDRWQNSFANFYADMGDRPEGYSLDRIDNNGNYCPENCRWADQKTQNRNKRNNALVSFKGERKTLREWAEVLGIRYKSLKRCISRSLDEMAVNRLMRS